MDMPLPGTVHSTNFMRVEEAIPHFDLKLDLEGMETAAATVEDSVCVRESLSRVRLFATPWTAARQAPRSVGFSRQEYWSGLPFPSPGIFPTQGSNQGLLHCRPILYQLSYKGSQKSTIV